MDWTFLTASLLALVHLSGPIIRCVKPFYVSHGSPAIFPWYTMAPPSSPRFGLTCTGLYHCCQCSNKYLLLLPIYSSNRGSIFSTPTDCRHGHFERLLLISFTAVTVSGIGTNLGISKTRIPIFYLEQWRPPPLTSPWDQVQRTFPLFWRLPSLRHRSYCRHHVNDFRCHHFCAVIAFVIWPETVFASSAYSHADCY